MRIELFLLKLIPAEEGRKLKINLIVSENVSSYFLCTLTNASEQRPEFTSVLLHGLAFGTPKYYIAPYGKTNHGLVNLSYTCDMKSAQRLEPFRQNL